MNFGEDLLPNDLTLVLSSHIDKVEVISSTIGDELVKSAQDKLEMLSLDANSPPRSAARVGGGVESRDRLVAWLERHRLPVKLEKNPSNENLSIINILDSVYIYPPYEISNAVSKNEIILNRIRNLMSDASL